MVLLMKLVEGVSLKQFKLVALNDYLMESQ